MGNSGTPQTRDSPFLTVSLKNDSIEDISRKIYQSCTTTGCFYITDHGLENQSEHVLERSKQFFGLDKNYKMSLLNHSNAFRCGKESGYDTLLQRIRGDVKEFYAVYCPENDKTKQLWVSEEVMSGFMGESHYFYHQLQELNHIILRHMAHALGFDLEYFTRSHTYNSTLRYHHYPSLRQNRETVLAHTDWGSITFLLQDTVGGLLVHDKETNMWIEAPPIKDAICCMCGDLLSMWTGGTFKSTLHKVVGRAGATDRYSVAYFVRPDEHVIIGDTTVGEYSRKRKLPSAQALVQKLETIYRYS
jgi:isopenicillin N synthase-like dioxygenase